MKIQINITKWNLILIIGIILIAAGGIVYAYNSAFNNDATKPPVFGHSADETNVEILGSVRTIQDVMNSVSGKTLCELTSKELRDLGCPTGTVIQRINNYVSGDGTPRDAYCKVFYSKNDNSADSSTNHILSCYNLQYRPPGGGPYQDPCVQTCTESIKWISCCAGGVTVVCEKTRSGAWAWVDQHLFMCR